VGALLAVALLGQAMTLNLWVGGLLIGAGVLFSIYPIERFFARSRTGAHDHTLLPESSHEVES